MLMHALAASCEELRARTGNPPLRPRLHYDATANTPLKIYYVSSIETIMCLHYNGVVCRSVLTTDHYVWHSGCKSLRYGKFAVAS